MEEEKERSAVQVTANHDYKRTTDQKKTKWTMMAPTRGMK